MSESPQGDFAVLHNPKIIKILIACLLLLSFLTPTYASAPPPAASYWDNFLVARPSIVFNPNRPVTRQISPYRAISYWDHLLSQYDWSVLEARNIMICESGGNSQAIGDKNTSYQSYGLFQIRALPGRPPPDWLLNPDNNVKFAYELYKRSGYSFSPHWTCAKILN